MEKTSQNIIGIDIGGTSIKAGKVADGKVAAVIRAETPKTRKEFIESLFSIIKCLADSGTSAVGVGFPAPVIRGTAGEVQNIPCLGGINIKNEIEKRFRIRCAVCNDADAFALAEQRMGAAKGLNNVIGITLGTGIGCGIIINREIYDGKSGSAGEISRIPFRDGKLEDYTSSRFILQKSGKNPESLGKSEVWNEYGANVGDAVAVAINAFDPDAVVIGGGIASKYSFFAKSMLASARKNTFKSAFAKTRISKAKLEDSGIIGAALFAGML